MATKIVFPETIDGEICREHVNAWVDYSIDSLKENVDNIISALNKNSESNSFLAKTGIAITIVGSVGSIIGAIYTYLAYIK